MIVTGVRVVRMVATTLLGPIHVAQFTSGLLVQLFQFDIAGRRLDGHRLQIVVSYDVLRWRAVK